MAYSDTSGLIGLQVSAPFRRRVNRAMNGCRFHSGSARVLLPPLTDVDASATRRRCRTQETEFKARGCEQEGSYEAGHPCSPCLNHRYRPTLGGIHHHYCRSNFRYRQLHEQPDNGKGHAGPNARINVQCSEFVMQLARSVRRACLERGGGSRVQDERRCPRPCLNADSDALHYRRLGRRRMSPARPWPCSPYHKYHGFCTHEPPVPGPPVIIHCSKEVKAQLLPPRPV